MHSGRYIGADQYDRATHSIEHGTVGAALAEISVRVEQARTAAASRGAPLRPPLLLLGTMERVGSNWLSDTLRVLMDQHNEPLRQQLAADHPLSPLNPDAVGLAEVGQHLTPYGTHWLAAFAVAKYAPVRQVVKETNLFLAVPNVLAMFPDAPVAVLTRSPLGVASSFVRGALFDRWGYAARYRHMVTMTRRPAWKTWADLVPDDKPSELVALVRLHVLNTLLLAGALDGREVVTIAYEDAVAHRNAAWAGLARLLPELEGVPLPVAAVARAPIGEDTFATTVNKTRLVAELSARSAEVVRETLTASLAAAKQLVAEQAISSEAMGRAAGWLSGDHLYALAPPPATAASRVRGASSSTVTEPVPCPVAWLPRGQVAWRNLLVTNAEYAHFLNELVDHGLHNTSGGAYVLCCEMPHERGGRLHRDPYGGRWTVSPGFENHPAYWVTWIGAAAFAARHGARLPLLSEMAGLMAGATATNADYAVGDTVAIIERGRGDDEIHHLLGNVQVWCVDGPNAGDGPVSRWLTGAAWNTPSAREEVTRLRHRHLAGSSRGVGIRLIADDLGRPMPVDLVAGLLSEWMSSLAERSLPLSMLDGRLVAAFTRSQADVRLGAHVGPGAGEPGLGQVGEAGGEAVLGQIGELDPLHTPDRSGISALGDVAHDAAGPDDLERHVHHVGGQVVAHVEETADLDVQPGLFVHLPHQGVGQALANLDLPSGKRPGPLGVGVLVEQQQTVVLDENAGDAYDLHPGNLSEDGLR